MLILLVLAPAARVSAQEAGRTFIFGPDPFSSRPTAAGTGEIVRNQAALEAREDVRLLSGAGRAATDDGGPLDTDARAYFRFHDLAPEARYFVVAQGTALDDPEHRDVVGEFTTNRSGYVEWSGPTELLVEPAVLLVRSGAPDGLTVLRERFYAQWPDVSTGACSRPQYGHGPATLVP